MKHCFRNGALFLLFKLLNLVVLSLPLKFTTYLGRLLGDLAYLVLREQRQRAIANLKLAFKDEKSDSQLRLIAQNVFQNLGRNLSELLSFPRINNSNIDRLVVTRGLERVDRVLRQGRGAIIVTGHFGNWELMAAYFGLKGYPSYVIARRIRFDKYNRILFSLRKSKNIVTIDRSESPRPILEALKRKGLVGVLPDQDVDSVGGVFVNFFGRLAYTPMGAVSLARAAKVPIVPCFMVRENHGHRLIVETPMEVSNTGNKEEDLKTDTQRWTNIVESYIRKYPEQWVWMHQRWKTKPLDS